MHHLNILALDLDGILGMNDIVEEATWEALRTAKKAGFIIFLVTGRWLEVLSDIGPFRRDLRSNYREKRCRDIFPKERFGRPPLRSGGAGRCPETGSIADPARRGMAITSTWVPHDKEVLDILSETGYAATIEYNKGVAMVLPP